jgi:hypothetical protein
MNTLIYDFETLSQEPADGVAVCLAWLVYDEKRLSDNPYTYEELLDLTEFVKFNVEEQVEIYNRQIQSDTLNWWKSQPAEARSVLTPSEDDVSITELPKLLRNKIPFSDLKKAYTRGNTFDPIMLRSLYKNVGEEDPTAWWIIRDTRSMIEGMSFGIKLKNNFIPEGLEDKFVAHDARHDIVMDVMRMQTLAQALKV